MKSKERLFKILKGLSKGVGAIFILFFFCFLIPPFFVNLLNLKLMILLALIGTPILFYGFYDKKQGLNKRGFWVTVIGAFIFRMLLYWI